MFSPKAMLVTSLDGLTNSISPLDKVGSPNGASELKKHFSGSSVRAVFTERGVNAADKSRYAFLCSFAKAITSIQFEPPKCPKMTGTEGYFLHRFINILIPVRVTGWKVCTHTGRFV